ncbi:S1C family serine protease [Tropicimonas sp. IMCC34011]|uniref:S1C family serine protease n=1 Tax=Tropicimonas sp. IMCC34011 TaxID=2248759 RepID=UPI000E23A599|nr:trypsin-like peptidase domain-containing protein [Tropicimonas sp. IMCC34011]
MRVLSRLILLLAATAALILAWNTPEIVRAFDRPSVAALPDPAPVSRDLAPNEEAVIETFETTRGSVVAISTSQRLAGAFGYGSREVPRGTGSGFVWDDRGHIITNAHVIEGASRAWVGLASGETYEAELVGVDARRDIAVLRIDADSVPPALPRGTSAPLRVGQSVLAIGNPFGLDWTLTTGVVSALDRELPSESGPALRGLIQTDAAINPGNSGGPLLDSSGRLIGMNSAIYSLSGASAGIGFAVPVDTLARVVPQLIERGHYSPPDLGIEANPRVNALARRQGLEGIVIMGVRPGSGAEEAGIEPARLSRRGGIVPGDILTEIDGTPVTTLEALQAALEEHRVGEEVTLTLERSGTARQEAVTLDAGA